MSTGQPGPFRLDDERLAELARLVQLGRLASSVAHDAATPLASIALRAESLLRRVDTTGIEPALAEKLRRQLATIHEETFRASRVLGALRGMAAPHARVNAEELARAAATAVESRAASAGVTIELAVAQDLPPFEGSAGALRLALLALLDNATQAAPRGGRVVLGARVTTPGRLEFTVEDAGAGLPRDVRQRLFAAFNSRRPAAEGLGLGLYLCDHVARGHGGSLRLEDIEPRGTRAVLSLPERNAARTGSGPAGGLGDGGTP